MTNKEVARSLRAIAQWAEDHPDLEPPNCIMTAKFQERVISHWYGTAMGQAAKEWIATIASSIGAPKYDKSSDESNYLMSGDAGDYIAQICVSHYAVCRKVKVGEKIVPASAKIIVPAQEQHTEPIYEWECPTSILKGGK
jgi:hypothetical protein